MCIGNDNPTCFDWGDCLCCPLISSRPVPDVSDAGGGRWFYDFLTMVYEGTYGIFSVALVITIAYSYAMEKNESLENVVMYVVVALAAFSAQLNLGTEDFDVAGLGNDRMFCGNVYRLFVLHGIFKAAQMP